MVPSTAINRFELGSTFSEFNLKMNQKGFIGASVLRPRIVGKQAASIGKVPLKELLQSRSTQRSPGSGFARDQFEFDQFSYSCKFYGKEEPLADENVAMYADIIDAEQIASDRAEDAILAEYERDVAAAVFNTTNFPSGQQQAVTGSAWDTPSTAKPINDVALALEKVALNGACEANALILNRKKLRDLMQTDQIVDRIKFTSRPTASEIRNALADLFDVKYILVAGGLKNTANDGVAAVTDRIWSSSYAMVARVAETDDPREPCIGRTFIWDGIGPGAPGDGGALVVSMKNYREEKVNGQIFQAANNRDIVLMYTQAGCLLTGV